MTAWSCFYWAASRNRSHQVRSCLAVGVSRGNVSHAVRCGQSSGQVCSRNLVRIHRCTTATSASVIWYRGRGMQPPCPAREREHITHESTQNSVRVQRLYGCQPARGDRVQHGTSETLPDHHCFNRRCPTLSKDKPSRHGFVLACGSCPPGRHTLQQQCRVWYSRGPGVAAAWCPYSCYPPRSASNALASWRSGVSKPSVNQPYIGASSS